MSEHEVVESYFPEAADAAMTASAEQATGPGDAPPPVAGADAPPEQQWAGPSQEEWSTMLSQFNAATEAAELAQSAAQIQEWALRAGPEAVDDWIADVEYQAQAAAQAEQEHLYELEQAHLEAAHIVEQIAAHDGIDELPVEVEHVLGFASDVLPEVVAELGYTHVESANPGFVRWKDLGFPMETPPQLTDAQRDRYSRHLLLPEVGEAGQAKILASQMLLLGAGGLGSPAALYLAAAGVGTIGIVDDDVVDVSNLQRQVNHTTDRVGMSKVESATIAINQLNPEVRVVGHQTRLTPENAEEIISQYDIVVDGVDNFDTRYLLNEVCVRQRKPNVSASILSFDGQITTFVAGVGPCYHCVYPEPPPPALAPTLGEVGVLGVLPGVMGLLQANDVMNLVLGIGEPLIVRLLMFDALGTSFMELKLRRDPDCPVCGGIEAADVPRAAVDNVA